jgi:hypothetical protein
MKDFLTAFLWKHVPGVVECALPEKPNQRMACLWRRGQLFNSMAHFGNNMPSFKEDESFLRSLIAHLQFCTETNSLRNPGLTVLARRQVFPRRPWSTNIQPEVLSSFWGADHLLTKWNLWPLVATHATLDAVLMIQVYFSGTGWPGSKGRPDWAVRPGGMFPFILDVLEFGGKG